jgi:hypothetical protein
LIPAKDVPKIECEFGLRKGNKFNVLLIRDQVKSTAIYANASPTSAKLSSWEEPTGTVHLKASVRKESPTAAGTLVKDTAVRLFLS